MQARQAEYLKKLTDLEHEMEVTRQEARLERMRRDQPIAVPIAVPPPVLAPPPVVQQVPATYESTPFETPAPPPAMQTTAIAHQPPMYSTTQPVNMLSMYFLCVICCKILLESISNHIYVKCY